MFYLKTNQYKFFLQDLKVGISTFNLTYLPWLRQIQTGGYSLKIWNNIIALNIGETPCILVKHLILPVNPSPPSNLAVQICSVSTEWHIGSVTKVQIWQDWVGGAGRGTRRNPIQLYAWHPPKGPTLQMALSQYMLDMHSTSIFKETPDART